MDIKTGVKRKRPGHESSYECSECLVPLVQILVAIYHQHKNYIAKYISLKMHKQYCLQRIIKRLFL